VVDYALSQNFETVHSKRQVRPAAEREHFWAREGWHRSRPGRAEAGLRGVRECRVPVGAHRPLPALPAPTATATTTTSR
jgi:hypothetical protein